MLTTKFKYFEVFKYSTSKYKKQNYASFNEKKMSHVFVTYICIPKAHLV